MSKDLELAGYQLRHPGERELYEALKKFHKGLTPEQERELRGLLEHINAQAKAGATHEDLESTRSALATNVTGVGTVRWESMRRDAADFARIHAFNRKRGLGHGHNEPVRPTR